MLNDILWHNGKTKLHVFIAGHGGVEVEILDINGHDFCIGGCADYAVDKEFDSKKVGSRCAHIA